MYSGKILQFIHIMKRNSDNVIIDFDNYTGQYSVTPLPNIDQILKTKNKLLKEDVIVEQIPYYETTNDAGGYTVIIG